MQRMSRRRIEEALVEGALQAARQLGVGVDRRAIREAIRSSASLDDAAGRLADLLQAAAGDREVERAGKVADP
jgi:hypothetical protein